MCFESRAAAVQLKEWCIATLRNDDGAFDRRAARSSGPYDANVCYGYLVAPLQEGYRFAAMGTLRNLLAHSGAHLASLARAAV